MMKEFMRSKKRVAVFAVWVVLIAGIFSGCGSEPKLELKDPTVYYGKDIAFSEFVDVTSEETEELQLTVTANPSETVSVDNEKQVIRFQDVGEYELEFVAEDSENQVSSKTMEVTVEDGTAPKIVLDGEFILEATDESALDYLQQLNAKDAIEGDLSELIEIDDSEVEYDEIGSYKITATVSDSSGNVCTKDFPVTVKDSEAPSLIASKTYFSLTEGESAPDYEDYISAEDNIDGDITEDIVIDDDDVNYDTPGVYYVKVKATDKSGNTSTKKLEVDVEEDVSNYSYYESESYDDSSDDYETESYSGGGTVYVTRTGECYHTHACGNGNYYEATLAEAEARGLRPCQKCY